MNRTFWNSVAARFDEEIFHALAGDRNDTIVSYIDRFKSKDVDTADFGCGVGRCLGALSDRFRQVHAVDFSGKCLAQARQVHSKRTNIIYAEHDLTREKVKFPDLKFVLCINAMIMGSAQAREVFWANLSRNVASGGHLLLVVPSLESALFAHFRVRDWNLRSGTNNNRRAFHRFGNGTEQKYSIPDGILKIENIATKHFLKEELMVLLGRAKFEVTSFDKVEYTWSTEITNPPRWMDKPYPWDWLVVAKRI